MDADEIIAKILFGLIKVAIIFAICVRIDLHSQGIDMRSGVVCDKQIVHHTFNDSNEYVFTEYPARKKLKSFLQSFLLTKGYICCQRKKRKNITPMPNMRSAKKAMKLWLRTLSAYRQRLMQSLMMLSKQNATRMRFTR